MIGARGDSPIALGVNDQRNLLYEFDPNTGIAFSNPPGNRAGNTGPNALTQGAWTQIVERAALDTTTDPLGPGQHLPFAPANPGSRRPLK